VGLKVVGAGLGRTGSHSLKIALETLLGGSCYHMVEVFPRPQHVALWHEAILGRALDWSSMFEGFSAAVDWPTAALWREIHDAIPESVVLLSARSSGDAWWKSFSLTILPMMQRGPEPDGADWYAMASDMLKALTPEYDDREACIAAYEAHNEAVRRTVPPDRLIEWSPGEDWGPICVGLGLQEPDMPFPHVNSTGEFRAMTGLDQPSGSAGAET
jgi:hypothetical protein